MLSMDFLSLGTHKEKMTEKKIFDIYNYVLYTIKVDYFFLKSFTLKKNNTLFSTKRIITLNVFRLGKVFTNKVPMRK